MSHATGRSAGGDGAGPACGCDGASADHLDVVKFGAPPGFLDQGSPVVPAGYVQHNAKPTCERRKGLRQRFLCAPNFYRRECSCGSHVVARGGCGARSCGICGPSRSARQAERVLERLGAAKPGVVHYLVLTVPEQLRARVANPADDLWRSALSDLVRYLRVRESLVFAYYRGHPCGEDGETFHPHANLLMVRRQDRGPWVDADGLKQAWGRALGLTVPAVAYVSYLRLDSAVGLRKLRHRVRYIERTFADWTWRGATSRWYGRYPRLGAPAPELGDLRVCPVCGVEFRLSALTSADREQVRGLFLRAGWIVPVDYRDTG